MVERVQINPYQAPAGITGKPSHRRKTRVWLLPVIVVSIIGAGEAGFHLMGDVWALTLFSLPGVPLFVSLQYWGLVPTGDGDEAIRDIWMTACNLISWGLVSWIISALYAGCIRSAPSAVDEVPSFAVKSDVETANERREDN